MQTNLTVATGLLFQVLAFLTQDSNLEHKATTKGLKQD